MIETEIEAIPSIGDHFSITGAADNSSRTEARKETLEDFDNLFVVRDVVWTPSATDGYAGDVQLNVQPSVDGPRGTEENLREFK
jgi:hypothetical protein